jgi:hypothetical protein
MPCACPNYELQITNYELRIIYLPHGIHSGSSQGLVHDKPEWIPGGL